MADMMIPEGWKILKLSKVLTGFQNGYAFSAKGYVSEGIPIISMGSINLDGTFKKNNPKIKYWNRNSRSDLERYIVKNNDLIIAMTDVTPTMELIGRACVVTSNEDCFLNQRVGLLQVNEKNASKKFLAYLTNHDKWRSYCIAISGLGAQANIGTTQILDGEILLPPLPEQQKIATILTSVDTVIEKTRAQIDKLKDLKTGMMQQLLTQGIGHTEFKDTPVGRIPKEWDVGTLDSFGVGIFDGDRGKEYPKENDFYPSEFCLFLSAKNVTKNGFLFNEMAFITQEKDKLLRKGKLTRGDIVITTRGTIGNIAFYSPDVIFENIRINSGMAIIRNKSTALSSEFLHLLMNSPIITEQTELLAFGSAQPQLTISIIKNLIVPKPNLDEQKAITSAVSAVNKKLQLANKKLDLLTSTKKALMQDLLTGKVRARSSS